MTSMKGRFAKKLRFMKHHGLVAEINSANSFLNVNFQIPSLYIEEDYKHRISSPLSNDTESSMDRFDKEVSLENTIAETDVYPSLSQFEEKCPPGGSDSVVLYTTSLRSIRKTFEDCHTILFLLQSFKVMFYERDVSMHLQFREELWRTLGGRVIPPRLFVRGRYIGGADEVVSLHEQGKLKKLLEGIPSILSSSPCTGCGNRRFIVCLNCNGCRKVFVDGESHEEMFIRCQECNENGLVKCSICS